MTLIIYQFLWTACGVKSCALSITLSNEFNRSFCIGLSTCWLIRDVGGVIIRGSIGGDTGKVTNPPAGVVNGFGMNGKL